MPGISGCLTEASGPVRLQHPHMSSEQPHPLRMTIEFDQDSVPIAGRVQQGDQAPQEFEGILELVSLVEAARRSAERRAANGEPA